MSDKFSPIPEREKLVEGGFVTRAWYQFLYKIFGDIFTRLSSLESSTADINTTLTTVGETLIDHEERIETLETP